MKGCCRLRPATELRSLRALAGPSLAYSSLHQMASIPRPARAAVVRLFQIRVAGSSFRSVVVSYVIRPVSPEGDLGITPSFRRKACPVLDTGQETRGAWVVRGCSSLSHSSPPSRPSPVKGERVSQRSPKGKASHWHNGGYGRSTTHASTGSARTVEGYLCTNGEGTPVHERWRVTCARTGKGHLSMNGEGTPEHERRRDT